jgi:nitronate monooxygenase
MGIGVSSWQLARAVAQCGQLGVVSGTAIDSVFVRRLQDGDYDGHLRRAIAAFPMPRVAARALDRYFKPEGRGDAPYTLLPMYRRYAGVEREALTMLAAFAEVFLAKEGHDGQVGINLLTKVQRPNLAVLYGAMLAGVDVVLIGAGIPREIPAILDAFASHRPASIRLDVIGEAPDVRTSFTIDPAQFWDSPPPTLSRPAFLPIVSSNSLAAMLAHKLGAGIQGFVIEGPIAGGHNAPPRGKQELNARGEPVYGRRDEVDYAEIAELRLPFWIAGGTGRANALSEARAKGAAGIQVGTLFAYCAESGIDPSLKRSVLDASQRDDVQVFTSPRASPTGYPFKVVNWAGSPAPASTRARNCDLGYLRTAYVRPDGTLGYRCPSEPVDEYVAKGGDTADTVGRECLCNALMSNIGLAQRLDDGSRELPLLTSGDDLTNIGPFLGSRTAYTAAEVIAFVSGS